MGLADESARAEAASKLDSTVRRLTCDADPYALIAHAASKKPMCGTEHAVAPLTIDMLKELTLHDLGFKYEDD